MHCKLFRTFNFNVPRTPIILQFFAEICELSYNNKCGQLFKKTRLMWQYKRDDVGIQTILWLYNVCLKDITLFMTEACLWAKAFTKTSRIYQVNSFTILRSHV